MTDKKLSVIVPIYNIEEYLPKCIDSLLAQDYEPVEIVLVNDGSKDGSRAICEAYASKHDNIKVINKENSGQSDARNMGVAQSTGDYILFIDGDDYVDEGMFSFLMEKILSHDVDVACSHHKDVYGDKIVYKNIQDEEGFCNGKEALEYMLAGTKIAGSSCAKVIKRKFFEKVKFPSGVIYEDAIFNKDLFFLVDNVYYSTKQFYNYWHRPGSSISSSYSRRDYDSIKAYTGIYNEIMEKAPELEEVALFRIYWANFMVLDKMLFEASYKNLEGYSEIVSYLKDNYRKIVKNKYTTKLRKLSALVLKINVGLYKLMLKAKKKKYSIE